MRLFVAASSDSSPSERADELESTLLDAFGKVRVLAQEAVARMNRLGVGHFGRRNDGRHIEIAKCRCRRTDANRLLRQLDVFGLAIGFRIDHHGLDAHLTAGALDTQRDLAAVGDQNLLEHGHSMMNSGWPYSTAWPLSPRICVTVPDLSASISLRIFMASMMQTVSPSLTLLPISTNAAAPGLDER